MYRSSKIKVNDFIRILHFKYEKLCLKYRLRIVPNSRDDYWRYSIARVQYMATEKNVKLKKSPKCTRLHHNCPCILNGGDQRKKTNFLLFAVCNVDDNRQSRSI